MDRNKQIKDLLLQGKTLDEVGKEFSISRERVRQLRNKYIKELDKNNSGMRLKINNRKLARKEQLKIKFNREQWLPNDYERAFSAAFTRKRQNARQRGIEFSIVMSDIEWPLYCPILGLKLAWLEEEGRQENSPSFDRFDPTKGYVKGNVYIISWRANRIKNDGSAEEHRKIADYLENNMNEQS